MIVSCRVRNNLRDSVQVGGSVGHYVDMSIVPYVVVVRRRVRHVLGTEHPLRNVLLLRQVSLLLWKILLLWNVLLLRYVVGDVRLMNSMVLKMWLPRRVRHLMKMRCGMRHLMQVIPVSNCIDMRCRMRHVVDVSLLVVVLPIRSLC